MTRPSQQADELRVLEIVCRHLGLCSSDFARPPADRPDYVRSDGAVGIELVEYQSDAHVADPARNMRRTASELDRIVEDAWAWTRKHAADVHFDVFVMPAHPRVTRRHDRAQLAAELGRLALEMAERGRGELRQEDLFRLTMEQHGAAALPDKSRVHLYQLIALICVHPRRPGNHRQDVWQATEGAFSEANPAAIQRLIDAKDANIEHYRKVAPANWLVVHASALPLIGSAKPNLTSSFGCATPELLAHRFETAFDRVLFVELGGLRTPGPAVYELKARTRR
jgi:hypothetical protein